MPRVGAEPEDISMYIGEEVGNKTEVEQDNTENEEVMEQVIERVHEQDVTDLPFADYESYRDREAKMSHAVVYPDVPRALSTRSSSRRTFLRTHWRTRWTLTSGRWRSSQQPRRELSYQFKNVTDDKIENIEAVEQRDAKKYKVSEPESEEEKLSEEELSDSCSQGKHQETGRWFVPELLRGGL